MNPASVPPIVMAGLAFFVGHYHLILFAKRRRHREDLYFALACLATCCYDLFCAGLYNAGSVQAGARWQRGQFIALAAFTPCLLWFIAEYTALKRRLVVYLFTAFFAAALVVQAVDRSSLTWILTAPSVKQVLLPFGLRLAYHEARLGWFSAIQGLAGLAASTYIYILTLGHYLRGRRARAGSLLIAMSVLFAAGINDTAVSQGLYQFFYLIEYGYMVLVMFVSFRLSREVVAGAMAEERFRGLVETTSDWVWEVDRNFKYSYSSPQVKEILGYEPWELIGRSPLDLMPPEEARRLEPMRQKLRHSGGRLARLENTALAKDGRLVHLETSAEPFYDQRGNLLGYRGIDRDLTVRRQAEAAQRESETLFRTLVESSPAGIFMVDDAYTFRYANDEACRILGYSREQLLGKDFRGVLDEDSVELVSQRYRQRQQGVALVPRYEIGILRQDGARRRLELAPSVVRGVDGRIRTIGQILDITERLRTEQALRQSHAVVLRSPAVLFRWQAAPGWPVELVSENVIHFGYTPEELLSGKVPYSALVHPEDLERVGGEVAQHTAAGRTSFQQEYRLVTRSGEVRWVDDRTVVERNQEGRATHYQGIVMDITERKLLERETEERRAYLERILAAAPDAIVTADERHAILEWNPGAQRLFGYSREEAIGRRIDELICGGDERIADQAARWTSRLDQAGSIPRTETVRVGKDGRPIDVLVSVAPIISGAKRLGAVAIYTDLSEQKRTESLLQALNRAALAMTRALTHEETFAAVARELAALGCQCLLLLLDAGRQVLRLQHLSYSREQMEYIEKAAGISLSGFELPTARLAEEWEQLARGQGVLRNGAAMLQVLVPALSSGQAEEIARTLSLKVCIAAPLVADSSIMGIFVVASDSLREQDLPAIAALANQIAAAWHKNDLLLELRRNLLELKKVQGQLVHAQKMEAIGRLAGGVAHDFNNQLTVIIGNAEMLFERCIRSRELRPEIEEILNTAQRSTQLTQQLLAFSRKQVSQPVSLDPRQLVQNLERMLRRLIGEDIELKLDLAPDTGWIHADPGQLEQVLMNLAVNARDAMPQGGKLVISSSNFALERTSLLGEVEIPAGRYVVLAVADTGTGIESQAMEHLFEPFFTTKPAGVGTGLGLAIVYGIVRQSGGTIAVESQPGRGSTFSIYLPYLEPPALPSPEQQRVEVPRGRGEGVLLVEDEASLARLLGQSLEEYGYEVLTAANSDEAIAVASAAAAAGARPRPIQLLLTDVIMPGSIPRREMVDTIARLHPELRVILMSGYTDEAILRQGVLRQGRRFLAKPFSMVRLLQLVRSVLDEAPGGPAQPGK